MFVYPGGVPVVVVLGRLELRGHVSMSKRCLVAVVLCTSEQQVNM